MTEQTDRWYIEYRDGDEPWLRWASGTVESGVRDTLAAMRREPEPQGREWRAVRESVVIETEDW